MVYEIISLDKEKIKKNILNYMNRNIQMIVKKIIKNNTFQENYILPNEQLMFITSNVNIDKKIIFKDFSYIITKISELILKYKLILIFLILFLIFIHYLKR